MEPNIRPASLDACSAVPWQSHWRDAQPTKHNRKVVARTMSRRGRPMPRTRRSGPKAIFMSRSARTGVGRLSDPTAAAGSQAEWTLTGVPIPTVTGSALTPAGTGPAMSRGAGPRTTMVAGIRARSLAGIGCRRRSGHPRGSPGGKVAATSAGRHWAHREGPW